MKKTVIEQQAEAFADVVNTAAEMVMKTVDASSGEFELNKFDGSIQGWELMRSIGAINSEGIVNYKSTSQKEVAAFILFNALELYGLAQKEVNTPLDFDVIESMIDQLEHLEHLKLKEK